MTSESHVKKRNCKILVFLERLKTILNVLIQSPSFLLETRSTKHRTALSQQTMITVFLILSFVQVTYSYQCHAQIQRQKCPTQSYALQIATPLGLLELCLQFALRVDGQSTLLTRFKPNQTFETPLVGNITFLADGPQPEVSKIAKLLA